MGIFTVLSSFFPDEFTELAGHTILKEEISEANIIHTNKQQWFLGSFQKAGSLTTAE